jgi:hypothetical protein
MSLTKKYPRDESMKSVSRFLTLSASVIAMAGVSLLGGFAAPAFAGEPAALTSAELSLQAAEDKLLQAEASHDADTVAQGFADEAHFVHANGWIQTKADFVDSVKSGKIPFKSINTQDRVIKVWGAGEGEVGVVRGQMNLVVGDMHLSGLYLAVYVMRDGRWQLLDSSTSPLPQKTEPTK